MRLARRHIGLVGVLIALLVVVGTAGGSPRPARSTAINVTERDFRINAPRHAAAGTVVVHVHNLGPDMHELIVVRARGAKLPMRTDGLTIDEDALDPDTAGNLEPGQPGSHRVLRLHLRPGRYEMFCNMAGHYLGGMHTDLVVR